MRALITLGLSAAIATHLFSPTQVAAAPGVRDITLELDPTRSGLGAYTITWGDNHVFDKNTDGFQDILLSYHLSRGWEIWTGSGANQYALDTTLTVDDRHNCASADFGSPGDNVPDGRIDLLCVIGAGAGTRTDKSNELLMQTPEGTFVNQANDRGLIDPSGRGRVVEVLDIRGDGKPSVFIGSRKGNRYPSYDRLYEYVDGRFHELTTGGLPSEQDSLCSTSGDFNRDLRQDFLTCSFRTRLYKNRTTVGGAARFREVALGQGIPNRASVDAELVDLNNDGWVDLLSATKDFVEVRLNRRSAPHFSRRSYRLDLRNINSLCVGSANGDRSTDILVVQGTSSREQKIQNADKMLVNQGTGRSYSVLKVPQPQVVNGRNGIGDTCVELPGYSEDGSAWVINNGRPDQRLPFDERAGYRQVVAFSNG